MRSLLTVSLFAAAVVPCITAADEDWLAFGQGATLHKTGPGVSLEYKIAPGQLGMAVLTNQEGKLAGMTHLQFRLRTDVSTVVAVMLSEKKPGGGDYSVAFWSPKDQWQDIDLTPTDFSLNDGPKDPKDPDGRLDLDQVQNVMVTDLGQMFSQADESKLPFTVTKLMGDHQLDLQNVHIVAQPGGSQERGVVIDDFHRSFLAWFTPGGAELSVSKSENPLKKRALEFRYKQDPSRLSVILHGLGQTDLRGAKALSFDVASTLDAHLLIALEEQKIDGKQGPRYNLDFTVSAGQTGHMNMPFAEFTLADDSPADPSGHLDLAKVRTISLVDLSGMLNGSDEKNTLWLADMRAQ